MNEEITRDYLELGIKSAINPNPIYINVGVDDLVGELKQISVNDFKRQNTSTYFRKPNINVEKIKVKTR